MAETLKVGPVEPLALFVADKSTVVAYACGVCRLVVGQGTDEGREDAAFHCAHKPCSKGCGRPASRLGDLCDACDRDRLNAAEAERERKAFEAAPKVSWRESNAESVFVDFRFGPDDGFFHGLGDLKDYLSDHPETELPEYCWACEEYGLGFDADDLIEHALEEHHEDAGENLSRSGRAALQKVLDQWVEDHAQFVKSFRPGETAILLDGFWDDEMIQERAALAEEADRG